MAFRVIRVIDGDTFEVSPNWKWKDEIGNIVRANGYNTPEENNPGYEAAKNKLEELILNKDVDLTNPIRITYGRLLCDVIFANMNLKDHFPEYQ
jgi:endonuclease YncB( thermonuclease family)